MQRLRLAGAQLNTVVGDIDGNVGLIVDAYREAAAEARERGWRIEEITGAQHLHIAVAPKPSPTRSSG